MGRSPSAQSEDGRWKELWRMRPPSFRAATELVARANSEGARKEGKLWFAPACRIKAERSKARVLAAA